MASRQPLSERFWAKVDKRGPDECWLWTGATNLRGYGRLTNNRPGGRQIFMAHRLSWAIRHARQIPDGLLICHTCDTPSCVNPDHLWAGSHSENMADMRRKGRKARGSLTAVCPECRHEFPVKGNHKTIGKSA